ncbi:MAG: 3'(2'),5'-bisphosphate nucleotidase CysQ [bacterium]|nr:3'(2'),5'-bisphosphate nucleotidase CysQ [bacterium]
MDLNGLLNEAKEASEMACREILSIYQHGDFTIESKSDNSPLTLADKASHEAIVSKLKHTGIPILSEEGESTEFEVRKDWEYFWMIDPLDGTKEFIKRNGEFTVNIALIHESQPILGVVQVPVTNKLYYAVLGMGAHLEYDGTTKRLAVNNFSINDSKLKVVASRSHLNEETEAFLSGLKDPQIVSMGSSLKLLAVAEGSADLYPRFAPTMEWDTAAAHIIVMEAEGTVVDNDTLELLSYNKKNLKNPHFLVKGNMA